LRLRARASVVALKSITDIFESTAIQQTGRLKLQAIAAFLAVLIGAAFFAAIPPWKQSIAALYATHLAATDCTDKKLPLNATPPPPQPRGPVVREVPN
jgi:hypothetical protein